MRKIQHLIFDWDGTLVDSAMSAYLTFQKALASVGILFSREQFDAYFTPDWHRMYEAVGLDAARFAEADEEWKNAYPCVAYGLVSEATETLSTLRERGYKLSVVTSGSRWRLDNEICDFGLSGFFEVVICNEDVFHRKPDPEGLQLAASKLGCSADCCSYIGDVPEDILAGKNAQMHTVGVQSLYPTSHKLANCNPDLNLSCIAELLEHY